MICHYKKYLALRVRFFFFTILRLFSYVFKMIFSLFRFSFVVLIIILVCWLDYHNISHQKKHKKKKFVLRRTSYKWIKKLFNYFIASNDESGFTSEIYVTLWWIHEFNWIQWKLSWEIFPLSWFKVPKHQLENPSIARD